MPDARPPLVEVRSPIAGLVVEVAAVGDVVATGSVVAVLESMKMEHPVTTPAAGVVTGVPAAEGANVAVGDVVVVVRAGAQAPGEEGDAGGPARTVDAAAPTGSGGTRADLAELHARRALVADDARPEAVARRHARGHRTARENLADLLDGGPLHEHGAFAIAAQRSRRELDDLRRNTAADGVIGGIGRVNEALVGTERSQCVVVAYDYAVLAGTQGQRGHQKIDRLFGLAERLRLPVVLEATGGGGRPGDTDHPVIAGLDVESFAAYARLSGLVPTVALVTGHCFAGNAALAGCSDVVIATADSSIGMGGPAMIEGGGLGTFAPEEVGPVEVLAAAGAVDVVVADDAEAVAVAKRYLSYFQGRVEHWQAHDQAALRDAVPENRLRVYDVRAVIDGLADVGSVLELRRAFAPGMITALARLEGRPVGILANDPTHLGGAIDPDGADKGARFLQLCEAFGLPVVFLCDTPGFMVGPDVEARAQVRHASRLFVAGAALTVPCFTVVLRKGYGLGAQAMAAGSFRSPVFTVAWPTGEFGGMGLEGAVRLGLRTELEALEGEARDELFRRAVDSLYEQGRALNMAANLEIDDVIDPAETRDRLVAGLAACPARLGTGDRSRHPVDPW